MVDWNYPKTVDEVVERLILELPLKDKVYIANLAHKDLYLLHISLRSYAGQEFGLWTGNKVLIGSCRFASGSNELNPEQRSEVILDALWRKLRETHVLRVAEKKNWF